MQLQLSTLQKMNKKMHIRRKRKRNAFKSDKALSGAEVEGMVKQEQVEA
jgi:hypothetical protein